MEKTTLSEAEVKVLMYMKDQKPHRESPQGMDADVFGVVCEMLVERNFVKRIKEDGPSFELYEPRIYSITVKGYEFIMALEQEMKWKREDFGADENFRGSLMHA